eukprot:833224-Rhodomonas_salina.1
MFFCFGSFLLVPPGTTAQLHGSCGTNLVRMLRAFFPGSEAVSGGQPASNLLLRIFTAQHCATFSLGSLSHIVEREIRRKEDLST